VGQQPWGYNVTTVETLTGDRPFLLDSVREYFRREGMPVQLTLHPVFSVERDGAKLLSLDDALSEGSKESHIYMQIGRVEDPKALEKIKTDLTEVLHAVMAMVDDFPSMLNILKNRVMGRSN